MHADMLIISLLTLIQSLVGAPWLVAATVRSLSHVTALSRYDKDGKVAKTMEQRVTGIAIHGLIGSCVILNGPRDLLAHLPKAVFIGLFMFLGVSSVRGNEMGERAMDVFRDPDLAPRRRWTDQVPTKTVNAFTFIQVLALWSMIWVKESHVGVLFPILVAGLAPLKVGLERWVFRKEDVAVLDED